MSFNRVKSTQELELEELEKAPKFKAKPLNKKVLYISSLYTFNYIMLRKISLNIIPCRFLRARVILVFLPTRRPRQQSPRSSIFVLTTAWDLLQLRIFSTRCVLK